MRFESLAKIADSVICCTHHFELKFLWHKLARSKRKTAGEGVKLGLKIENRFNCEFDIPTHNRRKPIQYEEEMSKMQGSISFMTLNTSLIISIPVQHMFEGVWTLDHPV